MRHIKKLDLLGLISDLWIQKADEALEKLEAYSPEERKKFIKDNWELWSELKTDLAKLSFDKCWYSEARIAPSELEIDHFRPKGKITKSKIPHQGYWWLAFDWKNFRLAYSLINKRRKDPRDNDVQGKGGYFPLLDEDKRVPDCEVISTDCESPQLIDPCIKSEVNFLNYAVEDGKVVERFKRSEYKIRHERAKASIKYYHLNEGTLIRDRHDLYVAIKHYADSIEALELLRENLGSLSEAQEEEYDKLINLIGDRINASSPYSSFARASLMQRGDRGWNTLLLQSS